jgi:hypothetical protein
MHLSIGGRFKLHENYTMTGIMNVDPEGGFAVIPGIWDPRAPDLACTMDLQFDPNDHNVFYFTTSQGVFKCNRRESDEPVKLGSDGLGTPTCLSMSDSEYLLVGFSCGSIA